MRYREPFTLFKRGKVYYYRTYDEYGKRTTAKSTGQANIVRARQHCADLIRDGRMVPTKTMKFGIYAENWFELDCDYIKAKNARAPEDRPAIGKTYASDCRNRLKNHIVPFFESFQIDAINPPLIDKFIIHLREKKLSAKTINATLSVLRIMITEAVRGNILTRNPFDVVKPLITSPARRKILTLEEIRKLFDQTTIETVWNKNLLYYTFSLTLALTGARKGELRGLRVEHYHDTYFYICSSYGKYGPGPVKTKENRNVPVPPIVHEYISGFIPESGYVFSCTKGKNPISASQVRRSFNNALKKIGIKESERLERNITMHSLRHWFNTYFRSANISDAKLKAVTGHKTAKMQDHYTHFDLENYSDVIAVQSGIIRETT